MLSVLQPTIPKSRFSIYYGINRAKRVNNSAEKKIKYTYFIAHKIQNYRLSPLSNICKDGKNTSKNLNL